MSDRDPMSFGSDEKTYDVVAIRLAANTCPEGRRFEDHVDCVWHNFCDWFRNREEFDLRVSSYIASKRDIK